MTPVPLNPRLSALGGYPFPRLNALLADLQPPPDLEPIVLSIGEPRHAPPPWAAARLAEAPGWGRYPPAPGEPSLRQAIHRWLLRRHGAAATLVDAETGIVPVSGTREALFMVAQAVLDPAAERRRAVLMPNPFYQVYHGAAVLNGGRAVPLPGAPGRPGIPDFSALSDSLLAETALVYLCSPSNPEGSVADQPTWIDLITLARRHGFAVIADECYSEIHYTEAPPAGALTACHALGQGLDNVLLFNSLSKRSSLPGLRSGFVAGDSRLVGALTAIRNYAMAGVPLPIQALSADLWDDEDHVAESRALYRTKLDRAEALLAGRFGYRRPEGGIFLWLKVGDGEAAARKLWREAAVKVLPGAYITRPEADGSNPGAPYIRLALVAEPAATEQAIERLIATLDEGADAR
ncbi:aminotransferase class I/II-fold pyridoxal phosphate-dependent enzyme [Roseospirillum parvum]|uniref:N-succinyldiaminopimelate aminotransferase n=1 Tax=Roseospirillum parvum TaxID=83401 RepID=A0A1G7Z8D8_9PROT|nr:aminotransferase class I/II-fold pyridoxal phosphate-dependent enzyme [Roseospirillum parvum]SDH05032.1 N-succinyldiaminopimelate aminotransferase [Roseospirillum parvum]